MQVKAWLRKFTAIKAAVNELQVV